MPREKKPLSLSVVSTLDPEFAETYRNYIKNYSPKHKGMIFRGLHALAATNPRLISRYVKFEIDQARQDFIGMGFNTTVFLNYPRVTKLHLASLAMNRSAQEKFARSKEAAHKVLVSTLGEFMLDQTINVGKLPYSSKSSVVYTDQEYHRVSDTGIFNAVGTTINPDAVDRLRSVSPDALDQLREFTAIGLNCYQTTGYVPDVLGKSNVGVDAAGKLIMVDSYPFHIKNNLSADYAVGQLKMLSEHLDLEGSRT